MIGIIDYQMGNVGSIENMLKRVKEKSIISSELDQLSKCNKLILPGVGSFDHGMNNLKQTGLIDFLYNFVVKEKIPILGICLGMHLLAKSSEEGLVKGLGFLDANVKKFKFTESSIKVPHMGWNVVKSKHSHLFQNMPEEKRFYFVHSYYLQCNKEDEIIGQTNYGFEFTSAVNKMNIWGTQFHPEKSHYCGMQLLSNFANL